MKPRAVWKGGQNEVREYLERFAKFAMCFPSGIQFFPGELQEFIGK